ncbi:MAG: Mini-ribonuclease 3 [Clostridia bacterium]|nr:Mini-ribonuclease 3 [Clostridia bacterium]
MNKNYPPALDVIAAKNFSPLALAFIGDAVYEEFIRTKVLLRANTSANKLHREAVHYVKAAAQSAAVNALLPELSEEEEAIFKRGRNAHSPSVPKNANVTEYRAATGFEALLGFLHLSCQKDRLLYLMEKAYEHISNN